MPRSDLVLGQIKYEAFFHNLHMKSNDHKQDQDPQTWRSKTGLPYMSCYNDCGKSNYIWISKVIFLFYTIQTIMVHEGIFKMISVAPQIKEHFIELEFWFLSVGTW